MNVIIDDIEDIRGFTLYRISVEDTRFGTVHGTVTTDDDHSESSFCNDMNVEIEFTDKELDDILDELWNVTAKGG